MSIFRAVFTALIAISVAMLPVPGVVAHAAADVSLHAADCCHEPMPCEKQARGCDSSAACTLKCFSLSGAVGPNASTYLEPAEAKMAVVGDQSVHAPAISPPLPPPRV